MYKFEEICELIKIVGASGLGSVEIEHAGSRVRIEGRVVVEGVPATAATALPPVAVAAPIVEGSPAIPEEAGHHIVTSPIVGTFYRAANPDAEPYVKAGDFVEKGQVMCIVEAMKLMNEIECDLTGTIVKIFSENEQAVEYGQPLFSISTE